jgi:hypothetical protein
MLTMGDEQILSGSAIGFNAAGTTPSPPDVLASLITATVFVSGVRRDFDLSLGLPAYAELGSAGGGDKVKTSFDAQSLTGRKEDGRGLERTVNGGSERRFPTVRSAGSRRKRPSGR